MWNPVRSPCVRKWRKKTGLSYSEISETLGIPEKTIKSRLFDARMMLKEKLGKNLKHVD
ncbi:MAG TPA: hypothetical protein GXX64_07505 [Bacteroidales bacterium]|nr:hypothetical protein [Bacteroidales bacterium]